MADEEGAGFAAAQHLLDLGHRRIAFVHGYLHSPTAQARLDGYQRALQTAGVAPEPAWTHALGGKFQLGARFTSQARQSMQGWLAEGWQELGCTAVVCHNDEAALGVIQALADHGIRVPQDVSVVGFDGTEYCDLVSPALTSVALPLQEIGATAVELLLNQITTGVINDEHITLSIQLHQRASSDALRIYKNGFPGGIHANSTN